MRKIYKVTLTVEERAELKTLVSIGKANAKKSNTPMSCLPSMEQKTDVSPIRMSPNNFIVIPIPLQISENDASKKDSKPLSNHSIHNFRTGRLRGVK